MKNSVHFGPLLGLFEVDGRCKDFLVRELGCENVLGFWNFAAIYQIQDLEEKFLDFVAYHYKQVQMAVEFLELTPLKISNSPRRI